MPIAIFIILVIIIIIIIIIWDEEKQILRKLPNQLYLLSSLSSKMKNNPKIFKAAWAIIAEGGCYWDILKYASNTLQDDKKLVLFLIQADYTNIESASLRLKDDLEVALTAVWLNWSSFSYISKRLQKYDFIKELADNLGLWQNYSIEKKEEEYKREKTEDIGYFDSKNISHCLNSLKRKKDYWHFLPRSWNNIDKTLQENKDFVMSALKIQYSLYFYLSDKLQKDKDILMCTFIWLWVNTQHIMDDNSNNQELFYSAVQSNWMILKYASDEIKNNKYIVLSAVADTPISLQYASEELRTDHEVILNAINNENVYYYNENTVLYYLSDVIKNNKEITLTAVKKLSSNLEYVSKELRENKDFIKQCLLEWKPLRDAYWFKFQFIWDNLKKDKDFILSVVKKYPDILSTIDASLHRDNDFIVNVVKESWEAIRYTEVFNMTYKTIDEKYNIIKHLLVESVRCNEKNLRFVPIKHLREFLRDYGEELLNFSKNFY